MSAPIRSSALQKALLVLPTAFMDAVRAAQEFEDSLARLREGLTDAGPGLTLAELLGPKTHERG